jgi:hypothetical protein
MTGMEMTMLLVGIGSLLGIVGLLAWETTTAFRKKMRLIEQLYDTE